MRIQQMKESQTFYTQLKSFLGFGLMVTAGFPLEMVRTRLQTVPELMRQGLITQQYGSVFNCVREIAGREGIRGFWKGNWANLMRIYPNQFGAYSIKQFIQAESKKYLMGNNYKVLVNMGSASISSCLILSVTYPLEFARARLTNDIAGKGSIKSFLVNIYKAEGLRGVYRGSINFFVSGAIFRAFYFGLFDTIKEHTADKSIQRMVGCYLSTLTAIFSVYPFDTVRKRMLMTSGHSFKYKNTMDCMKKIYAQNGIRSFLRGWQLSMMQALVSSAALLFLDKMGTNFKEAFVLETGQ